MPKMTGNRYFAEAVQAHGITHVFFVPTIMIPAMAEMEDMNVRRVVTHGEKAAAYMADAYARASHRPGLCLAQTIGSANLAAGLRDAYMAGSPVIALTGGNDASSRYKHVYQEIEDFPMWESVTKANFQVDALERFPDLLRQAFRVATSGAPGPVHLEMSGTHAQVLEHEGDLTPVWEQRFMTVPAFRPEPEPDAVRAALDVLARAERPVILAGGGVTWSGAEAELAALAERLQIPVATSLNAKAALSDDHPLNVGVPGTYSRWCANRVISEADLVFFIGSHAGGQVTTNWQVPKTGVAAIQLDIDPEELGRNYPLKAALLGDAKVTLQKLIASAPATSGRQPWLARVRQLVSEYREESDQMRDSGAVPIRPERICKEISDWLPEGGVVLSDTGHSGMWTGQMLRLTRPGQRYLRCAGSLGWGFPATLGAKCALPDRAVIGFCGDGGFYYHLAELETAARFGINAIMLVNNNYALNQEKHLFDAAYKGEQRGRATEMWHFSHDVNFARVAEAMGCVGIRVDRPDDIRPALDKALSSNAPAVVEVLSDVDAMSKRAWRPTPAAGH
ncbi:MAG TPA: thiamine pyrophosphate-binding protein [Candidatus Acidoferrum sp.]|nr:thiamine pyrophosphate-binding protein [Candidatus Acidoferrum sp.]